MTSAFLCADIGTSSLKAALIDMSGSVRAYSRQYFGGICHAGVLPHVSVSLWCDSFVRAVHALLHECCCEVLGICISGNGPTLVSDDGTLLLWNEPVPAYVPSAVGRSLFIPRLLFFRTVYHASWNNSRYIYSGPEYLIYWLTGTALTILPESRYREAYWTELSLAENEIEADKLPPFAAPGELAGYVRQEQAELLGLAERTPVYCGAPDFITALVGTDTLAPGRLCDRAGSSEGLNLCTREPVHESGIRTLPSVLPELYNASVLSMDSGSRFSEYKKRTAPQLSYAALIDRLIQEGSGEGFALMADIAGGVRRGVELLREIAHQQGAGDVQSMCITGGQAKNSAWVQFKSSAAGIAIIVPECPDSELVGDAVFAGLGRGEFSSIAEGAQALFHAAQVYEPEHTVE